MPVCLRYDLRTPFAHHIARHNIADIKRCAPAQRVPHAPLRTRSWRSHRFQVGMVFRPGRAVVGTHQLGGGLSPRQVMQADFDIVRGEHAPPDHQ
jgi:hypothetical protein